jgi:hypothetical protein
MLLATASRGEQAGNPSLAETSIRTISDSMVRRLKRCRQGLLEDKGSAPMTNIRGLRSWIAWTGGLGFSLLVGPLADTLGYRPLFGLIGVFDLVGAAGLIVLIGGERPTARFAAA